MKDIKMGEAKFTKGDWWVNPIGSHWNNPSIASYEICWSPDGECVVDHVYEHADALLIACAPEMYEEIKKDVNTLSEFIKTLKPHSPDWIFYSNELKRKAHLLAKIKGNNQ